MSKDTIEQQFRQSIGEAVRVLPEGRSRYRVFTPHRLEDGDHLCVVLRKNEGKWVLTDEGHTFMHLTYDMDERDIRDGNRGTIVENALRLHGLVDLDGELVLEVDGERFGDALFSYVQALTTLATIGLLSRERAKITSPID